MTASFDCRLTLLYNPQICTRLPVPDIDFQHGQQVLGSFLSEAMTEHNPQALSPFNECLILVTICGRSLLHGQQYKISKAYGDMALDSTEQRHWLDSILTTRLQVLSQSFPSPTEAFDPLLLFANILAQATVVYFCNGVMESVANSSDPLEACTEVLECQNRALTATKTIVLLAKALRELHFSKASQIFPRAWCP